MSEAIPSWRTCSCHGCDQPAFDASVPYCDKHIPTGGWVTPEQCRKAKKLMRGGLGLYQAAKMVRADARDMDLALWDNIGGRKAGMF